MKHGTLVLAATLVIGASTPTLAQTPDSSSQLRKIELTGPKASPAPAPAAPATDKAPFGCDARAPNVCHFQIFYARGGRAMILAAGTKTTVPDVKIGSDGYCVALNKAPAFKCARKTINAAYNN
jgi:hypothetical protein